MPEFSAINNVRLFTYVQHEKKKAIDQLLENCYAKIQFLLKSDPSGKELTQYAMINSEQHDEIIFGYFYGILVDTKCSDEYFRSILLHSLDHLESVTHLCSELIIHEIKHLQLPCKLQICWFIEQGVRSGIKRLSSLIHQLLRELQVMPIEVLFKVVKMFEDNIGWVMSTSILSGMVVYTLMPLIRRTDTRGDIDKRMATLCVRLIRQRWPECSRIGRDFLRALNSVCLNAEFFNLWQDIMRGSLPDQQENQLETILFQKTQKKFLLSRLTHETERMILFVLNEVKLNDDISFYKEWIEHHISISNRIDLIRYLCSPACDVSKLNSNIDTERTSNREDVRKHILYWLVVSVEGSSTIDVINVRVAFLFDWLVYQPNRHQPIDPNITKCFNWFVRFLTELSRHFLPCLATKLSECVKQFVSNVWRGDQIMNHNEEIYDKPNTVQGMCEKTIHIDTICTNISNVTYDDLIALRNKTQCV